MKVQTEKLRAAAAAHDERQRFTSSSTESAGDYASVSVSCGANACSPAMEIAGQRILESEAPQLPLPKCTAKHCDCRFFHYRDRRNFLGNRRANTLDGAFPATPRRGNRRKGPSRRRLRVIGGH
jgi:hypothetical protein